MKSQAPQGASFSQMAIELAHAAKTQQRDRSRTMTWVAAAFHVHQVAPCHGLLLLSGRTILVFDRGSGMAVAMGKEAGISF